MIWSNKGQIVFFIFSLNGGGAAKILLRLASRYNTMKSVSIITLEEPDGTYKVPENIKVNVLKVKNSNPFLFYVTTITLLRRELKSINPEKLISFIHIANIVSTISLIGTGIKNIVCERSDIQKTNIGVFWKLIRPVAYFFSNGIVLQNSTDVEKFPIFLKSKILFARNPISETLMPTENFSHRLISVGRLHQVKRYDMIIRMISVLLKNNPEIQYWIYGEGVMKNELQKLILELNLEKQIILKGHHNDIETIVSECSVFLMASQSEGQPNALIEALALGLDAICFGTSDCFFEIQKIFKDLNIVKEGNQAEYISKLKNLLEKPKTSRLIETQLQKINQWNNSSLQVWDKIVI